MQTLSLSFRFAAATDAPLLAAHRVGMFHDMGAIVAAREDDLRRTSAAYFAAAIPAGEYVGWIVTTTDDPNPIAGGGVQLRSLLPRPDASGEGLLLGREGLVLNIYTEPRWRRRGVARRLMEEIIRWAAGAGVVRLVLSASPDGRPLYEQLGFDSTREMSYTGAVAATGPWLGETGFEARHR